jgi:diguanylate cyclase (GGDEF)-like protein
MVDIDRFKSVNDTYGHAVGDNVLYGTAQIVRHFSMPHGVVCRYGGEELIIFFRSTSESDAFSICERIRREVKGRPHVFENREFTVSVSIGLSHCDDTAVPMERVLKSADEALYKAKETGRNKVLIGRLPRRDHNIERATYRFMKSPARDRRKNNPDQDQ